MPNVTRRTTRGARVSPFWVWTQALIVLFVLAGIVIAIVKLA
jgi:hypothetical protein